MSLCIHHFRRMKNMFLKESGDAYGPSADFFDTHGTLSSLGQRGKIPQQLRCWLASGRQLQDEHVCLLIPI